jgi:hypothetical protein
MVLLAATNVQPLTPACAINFNLGIEQKAGVSLRFRRIFLEVYPRRLRLQHDSEYPAEFSNSIPEGQDRRSHGARDACRRAWVQRICRLRSHALESISARPMPRWRAPDHDQPFQQSTNLHYQFSQRRLRGLWLGFTRRFDSGLVVVSVPDYATALTLTGDDQQTIGLYCGDTFATINQPLRACNSPRYRATLIHIAVPGTYNADTNPSRIAPHDLLDVALGSQVCGRKITIANLSDRVALYNFLSSFSGTHFIRPAPLKQS